MGTRSALGVILGLLLWCATTAALAEGNANISLGVRSLDEGTWSPVDDHVMGGVSVDFAGKGWPLHLAAGIYQSDDEETERAKEIGICLPIFCTPSENVVAKASVSELALGIVKIWKPGERVRLFLGGGGSIVATELKFPETGVGADDQSPGMYATAGIFWASVTEFPVHFNFGFEVKFLAGTDIELFGVKGDADYKQLSALFGLGW